MNNNSQSLSYPSPKDLYTILSESVTKSQMMSFLSTKGIYYFNITGNELAERISQMVLDAEDLNILRAFAYRSSNKQILSGFTLYSDKQFDLNLIYEDIRDNGAVSPDGYKLKSIHKIQSSDNVLYGGSLTYTRKTAGRIEFIRTEERDVSFVMKKDNENTWRIEVDGGKSNDGKIVFNMFRKTLQERDIKSEMLRIDYLTRQQTIDFFDKLAKQGLDKTWIVEDVEKITLKRNAGNKEEKDDSETIEEELSSEHLSGITQAILEGKNLRENAFVKQAEELGYAFTSMTYIYASKDNKKKIKLRAEFKGNPKIFEVCLENFMQPDDDGNFFEAIASLPDKENLKIRSLFWNNANIIYRDLLASS